MPIQGRVRRIGKEVEVLHMRVSRRVMTRL
jgi:hypothetical protein